MAPNGEIHGVILTPVPEPSAIAILGSPLLTIVAARAARKRSGRKTPG
jgi:hypothetical protein